MTDVFGVVFPVFFAIGVGYLFALWKKISLEPIIEILLYITIPALVISSLTENSFRIADVWQIALSASLVIFGTGVLSYLYLSLAGKKDIRGFYLPTMFMNSGNMAFPLALLAFGKEGLAVAVIYYIVVSLLVYSVGIYIAKGGGGFKEMFRLPLIYSAGIGLGLNIGGVSLPAPIETTLGLLGGATIPLMLLSLGYQLHSAKLTSFGMSFAGSLIRIGGGFVFAYLITAVLGIEGTNRSVIILASAMPSAVINFIISYRYKVHSELVSSIVAMTTVMSIITTPIVLMWLM